ncbi:MAG: tRNA pseudouridine(55) synthase TruB [Gemmatimonadaceae bacterium]
MEETTPRPDRDRSGEGDGGKSIGGLLLVDKPAAITSHDVVQRIRQIYGERSIGHLGTLDPFATGLLVLLIGRSTRLATFLDTEPKVYEAAIAFGSETDTDDATGAVTRTGALPREADVRTAITRLTGSIEQIPPAYSAKSVDGVRAYDAARRGEPLDLAPVSVTVHEWEVRAIDEGSLRAVITCSGGTYIRALARDLGRAIGSAAHLSALRRTRVGEFDVRNAFSLEQLTADRPPLRALRVVTDG